MTTKHESSPALAALREHQHLLAALLAESTLLERRIEGFRATAEAEQPSQQRLQALVASRRETLAAVALGEVDANELDRLDRAVAEAEQQARGAARGREVAEAGTARLRVEHDALAGKITTEGRLGPALRYAAAVEHAETKRAPLEAAAAAFAAALAEAQGAVEAINAHADPRAVPPRAFAPHVLAAARFDVPTLTLPGAEFEALSVDGEEQIAAARVAALAVLAGR